MDLGVGYLFRGRHVEHGADLGHVGLDLLVQLAAFLRQSPFVLVHLLQRVEQLRELGVKTLQAEFAGQLCQRLSHHRHTVSTQHSSASEVTIVWRMYKFDCYCYASAPIGRRCLSPNRAEAVSDAFVLRLSDVCLSDVCRVHRASLENTEA